MIANQIDVISLGCSKNLVDSDALMHRLAQYGYTLRHDPEELTGEIAVVNTCGFIQAAQEESINLILSLIEAKKEGRIRAIGVTSFSNERLQDLFLHNEIKPVVNQLETHPFFQQQAANAFLQQEGIQHEAWAPFAEGQNDIFNHPTLKAIAEQHDKGVGAIILRWLNQRNIVVIPKSVHKERMIENFNILDFTLSKEEMDAIALLETGKSPIYDDMDLLTVKGIGLHKIHE